jgi:hypothetical protein
LLLPLTALLLLVLLQGAFSRISSSSGSSLEATAATRLPLVNSSSSVSLLLPLLPRCLCLDALYGLYCLTIYQLMLLLDQQLSSFWKLLLNLHGLLLLLLLLWLMLLMCFKLLQCFVLLLVLLVHVLLLLRFCCRHRRLLNSSSRGTGCCFS